MANQAKVAEAYLELSLSTVKFKAAIGEADSDIKKFKNSLKAEMGASRGALRILNEELRVHRPRALQSFVTKLPGVACAMNAAFNAIAVLALIDIVVQAGRKIDEFVTKNQEAARKHQESWRQIVNPMRVSNDELQVANDRLENSIAKLSDQDQRAP